MRFFGCLITLLLVAAARPAAAQPVNLDDLVFDPLTTGLVRPLAITHAGDGSGRLFITLQRGRIVVFDCGQVLDTPFLDIRGKVRCCGERGLLSVAFHSNFPSNGLFFVNYTDTSGDTVVARYHSPDRNVADPDSEAVLLTVPQPFGNHNGGQLQFGPGGFLYIGMGDGGSARDPGNRAQDPSALLGKMLRIDVDSGDPFSIPASNPFVGRADAQPAIWALGLRNPWRFSFDRATGDMFIGDVGQNAVEEVSFQPAGVGGLNYGWRRMEGSACFNPTSACNDGSLTLPILDYGHAAQRCGGSVTGGYRYRGPDFPQLNGIYFFGDFCTGSLYAGVEDGGQWTLVGPRATGFSISTFGEDEQGELYLADYANGVIYAISTDSPAPVLSSLSPAALVAGAPDMTLTVVGSAFVPDSVVRWNDEPRPTVFLDNSRLQAAVSAADIAGPGTATVAVVNPSPGGGISAPLLLIIEAPPNLSPNINSGGVVNAASFTAGQGLAPGTIASVFGVDLALRPEAAIGEPLPVSLGGSNLLFNGSIPVPQFFVSQTQSNIQIPWELVPGQEASLTARIGSRESPPTTVSILEFSPGLFSIDQSGAGQGAILISGTSALAAPAGLRTGSRPVKRGEFLEIFATGLGAVTNTPPTGSGALADPLSKSITLPTLTIGGVPTEPLFAGLAPGFVGLYQVNAEVLPATPVSDSVALTLSVKEAVSNTVTIAVE